jgi:hypothetical protein
MFKLSRRTVVALAVSSGAFAMPGIVVPSPAVADNKEIAQVLRAGGFVIVFRHCATLPNQADTDPLNFDDLAAQRNLNDKGRCWRRLLATPSVRSVFPSAKFTPASTTERMKQRTSPASRISRRPRTSPKAASSQHQLLTGELSMTARITLAGLELLVLTMAAVASSTQPSRADSCSRDIDRAWVQVNGKIRARSAAGRSLPQSTIGLLHRQPTQSSIAAAEETLVDGWLPMADGCGCLVSRSRGGPRQ